MKVNMKRLLASLLAVVMMMGMGAIAFAAVDDDVDAGADTAATDAADADAADDTAADDAADDDAADDAVATATADAAPAATTNPSTGAADLVIPMAVVGFGLILTGGAVAVTGKNRA